MCSPSFRSRCLHWLRVGDSTGVLPDWNQRVSLTLNYWSWVIEHEPGWCIYTAFCLLGTSFLWRFDILFRLFEIGRSFCSYWFDICVPRVSRWLGPDFSYVNTTCSHFCLFWIPSSFNIQSGYCCTYFLPIWGQLPVAFWYSFPPIWKLWIFSSPRMLGPCHSYINTTLLLVLDSLRS